MNNSSTSYLAVYRNFDLDDDELRLQLSNTYVQVAQSVNARQTGFFTDQELQNGQNWYQQLKPAFRKIISFGPIAPGATLNIAHDIDSLTEVVDYWAVVTTSSDWRKLPYASVTANQNIEMLVTPTQVTIISGSASPAIIKGVAVLNYLKS